MSKSFYDAVQSALETYACELGAEPWFYAAAGFAAAGQGVGALAATVGGIATATACNKPPTGPSQAEDKPFVTFESPLYPDKKLWTVLYEGSYRTYDITKPGIGGQGTQCDYPAIESYRVLVESRYQTRQLKLAVGIHRISPGICGTIVFGGFHWTYENPVWQKSAYYTWVCWDHQVTYRGWIVGETPPPPQAPKPPPPRLINLKWTQNNIEVNNNIQIGAPDFIFAPSGDFNLSFPINVMTGPVFNIPFNFNFDLNYSTGGQGEPDGYGNKPKGGGPRLPPAERPKECPEIPEDPEISGSWSKADCVNGEPLFTPVNWKGKGFSGVADALNKLNSVIGPWQENTYDCDDNLPAEPMVGIPVSQYTGATSFEPSITLWFYEPNLLAIQAGRTYRVRRCISVPVATPPANPKSFLDGEIAYWEGFEWQCGFTTCRASLTGGRSFVLCNAINAAEGERVLTRVLTRYGFAFDKSGGFRATVGASPSDSTGRGGLRIQTTVRFHSASFATMNQTWGPISPDSVYARGPTNRS